MALKGSIGKLYRGTSAETLALIADVLRVDMPESAATVEELTPLGATSIQRLTGLVDHGMAKAEVILSHTIYATLKGDVESGTSRFWAVELGEKTYHVQGPATKVKPKEFTNKTVALTADFEFAVNSYTVDDTEEE